MRITQGTFSYLPDFTDEEIKAQIQYCLNNDWPISIEYTDDPHPRNVYWEMFGMPMFDIRDPAAIMQTLAECKATFPNHYIRISGFDRSLGRATTALQFIVNRPANEPGFHLERQEVSDRQIRYTIRSYASEKPSGQRYE
ncbi:ribulose-1,5-bisphosphate carboxylase/oxygenase small subunit-2 [Oscillochloris trichoides DG-6]|uniref:Ribulose-1,5-bisphosphate carboxylase/oxygenase small subunit-2 n=1 Tax=Oscillochloris trichoides DG-6 TaxID=765420 RepID=E1IGS2_9CHLR|nr:ribulose bisphosphate carboxylase small subunit [Oscillochloris trichoides]EFO79598.1 ribulose-1,5-bisphosphate carboxylase/oxygenase small subunit-2 [Oscillochloris trichoides DG-6]